MEQENPPLPFPKRRMQRLIAIPLALVAVVALLYLVSRPLGGGAPRPSFFVVGPAAPGVQIGQIAPGTARAVGSASLPLIGLDDRPVALTDFAGKPIWVIFWKTACKPCETEAADVAAAYAAHRADGLVVIGVDLWDSAAVVRDYAAGHTLNFPVAIAPTSAVMDAYGVWGAPTHYFIDAAGIIQDRYFGPMTRQQMDESMRKII